MKRTLTLLSAVGVTLLLAHSTFSQSTPRNEIKRQIEQKRAELDALEAQYLAPSEADRAAYALLLSQPDTGLIRLLPRERYDDDYKENLRTITLRGGGAYYSFTKLTHEYGYGSDISLESGRLSTGFAGADYGMLRKIGRMPLEEITVDHPSIRGLARYQAVSYEPDARIEQRRFSEGAEIDGGLFKRTIPLEVGATYVLRSVQFHKADVLVAFHVVRKDEDGSAILAWRLFKKYSTPRLERPMPTRPLLR